jgi:peptidoglycan/xylan/chitin deacetylase (PgdA/CDA1 family)
MAGMAGGDRGARRKGEMSSIQRVMRRAAGRLIRAAPLHVAPLGFWRTLVPKTDLGICYHMVSDHPVRHLKHYRFLDPDGFQSDLDYLAARFEFVNYGELTRRRSSGISKGSSVILTFDDGFAECATIVAPLLRQRGLSCVFFVITDFIDNRLLFRESAASLCIEALMRVPFEEVDTLLRDLGREELLRPRADDFSWSRTSGLPAVLADPAGDPDRRLVPLLRRLLQLPASEEPLLQALLARLAIDPRRYLQQAQPYLTTHQLRQLHADGFTIGAHSCSHRRLQELPRAEAEREIVESCRIVRDITGEASVPFAFPYYGGGLDRDWLAGLRRQHDFLGLFFDTQGLRADASFVVQRVFGERFNDERNLDAVLRRAWADPAAWRAERRE